MCSIPRGPNTETAGTRRGITWPTGSNSFATRLLRGRHHHRSQHHTSSTLTSIATAKDLHGGRIPIAKVGSEQCRPFIRHSPGSSTSSGSSFLGKEALYSGAAPASDDFSFAIQPRISTSLTKRRVLAETARLFDPLGWLSSVISRAKILIQSTWLKRLEWDTPLPAEDAKQWQLLLTELPSLRQLRIKRWLRTGSDETHIELHGFADASERGFGAVVYLRTTSVNDPSSHLLAAKSKVAPVHQARDSSSSRTLCRRLVGHLMSHIRSSLDLSAASVYLWTDSKVTLHWIKGHASRWKTYVANRVSSIQQKLPNAHWRHVPGRENPDDCASRGISPKDLLDHPLWWTGPNWLRQDSSQWPNGDGEDPIEDIPEIRSTLSVTTYQTTTEPEILLRFSLLHKLLRVSAWYHRWRRTNIHAHDATLHTGEIDAALLR